MVNKFAETVTGEQVLSWIVVALLVGYFIYKEWPEFKKRMNAGAKKEQMEIYADESIKKELENINKRLDVIDLKLTRDYNRINTVEEKTKENRRMMEQSLEEREMLMKAMLAALEGLQELGANGPTKAATKELQEYLNLQAHKIEHETV